jgi:hypothetical protein
MSLLYPNTIAVHRPITVAGVSDSVGLVGYSGMTENPASTDSGQQGETVLYTGVPASIQARQTGRKRDSALPSDAVFAPTWAILVPESALPKGSVRDRDIIVDELGYRYEVAQDYWNLGYQLNCIRLEA